MMNRLNGLVEGDQIKVLTVGGFCDTGVFVRVENNFLLWVRNDSNNASIAVLTVSSLAGISVSKL